MHYFYAMQKPLQQLDLFGMPVEPVSAPAKKKPVVKEKPAEPLPLITEAVAEPEPIIEKVAAVIEPASLPEPVIEKTTPINDPVVFADERIVVKIKAKVPQPVIIEQQEPEIPVVISSDNNLRQPGKRGRKSFREIDTEVDLIEVPDEETLKQKLYYSISEVAGWFKVNTSLLRYWENEFDVLQPRKTRKGDRLFRVEDIKNLQLIYFLLRQRKFSIEGARNYLKQNKGQADVQLQLVQSLTKFKSFLLELKAGLGN
jgi:DNA-binding transcriptional MerR regulator